MSEQTQTAHDDDDETLKVPTLAQEWECGTRPIYRHIKEGRLKAFPINDRGDLRITRGAVREFIERRSATARA